MLGGPVATGGATPQGLHLVSLINDIAAANTTSANNTSETASDSTKSEDKQDDLKQMSRGELLTLLHMCVNSSTVELADLPAWLQDAQPRVQLSHTS